jgi:hypothetical protein
MIPQPRNPMNATNQNPRRSEITTLQTSPVSRKIRASIEMVTLFKSKAASYGIFPYGKPFLRC